MKKKLLLFMAMIVACGVMLAPKPAMAQVTSDAETFTVTVPTGAAWGINPTANTFTISSQHFTWSDVAGTPTADITPLTFGIIATPVSFLITNDVPTVDDEVVTLTIANGANTTATFIDVDTIRLVHGVATATVDLDITDIGGGGPAEIGGLAFAFVDANNLSTTAALAGGSMAEVGATNKFAIDLQMDVDQATLTKDDEPCALVFDLTFTVASVVP